MTEEVALLRAIIDAPADDAPRLVYADWLDEHDQSERANLIRAMIADKGLGYKPSELRAMFPYVNVNTPIRLDHDRPVVPLASPVRAVIVRRGFIDEVRVAWKTWKWIGREIAANNPVRYVGIRNIGLESSCDGTTPRPDVLWVWEDLPHELSHVVPTTWIASNTKSPGD